MVEFANQRLTRGYLPPHRRHSKVANNCQTHMITRWMRNLGLFFSVGLLCENNDSVIDGSSLYIAVWSVTTNPVAPAVSLLFPPSPPHSTKPSMGKETNIWTQKQSISLTIDLALEHYLDSTRGSSVTAEVLYHFSGRPLGHMDCALRCRRFWSLVINLLPLSVPFFFLLKF